ncbi:A24 family peptidase [Paenibacillus xylaniclasticus]|uniref:A24 family peptidase n=1 Tax=Paenibacillus xylaniclasticus TaxID=588083 RepID=UPI0013E0150E|nr:MULTISPECIES: A24 family peptidase [Paenibacillus]
MAYVGALVLVILASITDIRSMRIPNPLTAASFAVGLIAGFAASGIQGGWSSLMGAAAGTAPLLLLYMFKGVGGGDVKLFAALGAWLGVPMILELVLYSILCAGAIGLLLIVLSRLFVWPGRLFVCGGTRQDDAEARTVHRFPFMLAVVPAFAACWWYSG